MRLIHTHDHILSAFDRSIAAYATQQFRRSGIDLVLGCRVSSPFVASGCLLAAVQSIVAEILHAFGGVHACVEVFVIIFKSHPPVLSLSPSPLFLGCMLLDCLACTHSLICTQ